MTNYKTTFLTYMQCVSDTLELLTPIESIKSIYLMGSFARGDYEVGQSDIDLTIITKNLDERSLLELSLNVGEIVSALKKKNEQYVHLLSMPKISTYSDWYNTEALDPAEYGIRDQKEAKLLYGENIFLDPIIPLCDVRADILDSLITHSIIAMGEATYTLMKYDAVDFEKQSYWFWKSFLNALRYYFWLAGDIYLSKLQDVLSVARIIFEKEHPFLKDLSNKNEITFETVVDAYNFLTAICLKSINLINYPGSKVEISELASVNSFIKTGQSLSLSMSDMPNWIWKNWLKPALPRTFIVVSQPALFSRDDKKKVVEHLTMLSLQKEKSFPILINKEVYEYFIGNTNPLAGYFLLKRNAEEKLIVNPSMEKMRLLSKKALAYFFYNWTNSYVETYQAPENHFRLINKIIFIQAALLNLRTGMVETDFTKIPELFQETFPDFGFKNFGYQHFDIQLFPRFVYSLKDYIFDDITRPGILYL